MDKKIIINKNILLSLLILNEISNNSRLSLEAIGVFSLLLSECDLSISLEYVKKEYIPKNDEVSFDNGLKELEKKGYCKVFHNQEI